MCLGKTESDTCKKKNRGGQDANHHAKQISIMPRGYSLSKKRAIV
jgi:hypothetical protein